MDVPDEILDWPVEYWENWEGVVFICSYVTLSQHPDKRCKSGVRTDRNRCGWEYGGWDTVRELIGEIERHTSAHP